MKRKIKKIRRAFFLAQFLFNYRELLEKNALLFKKEIERQVRYNPIHSLFTAVCVGFVISRLKK